MSIVLNGLTKSFAGHIVVHNVSLRVEEGELFVLLGGSGSGKSTILRMIAGLLAPDSGRVELHGRDVTDLPVQDRSTGFVFQNYSVFRHMTVAQNVAFGLMIRKLPAEEQRRRVEELLDLVDLAGLGDRYPSQLSGGQLQRVALSRALAYQPQVLLLDEPFSALDVKIRGQLRQSLQQIQRTLGITSILVTHDQEEAFELADRIGVMNRGLLVEVGTPEQLYHHPRTAFAATFVGGGNVLVGRAEGRQIRLGDVQLPFPDGAPEHDEGAPVRILFRPETVELTEDACSGDTGMASLGRGQVIQRVFSGSLERFRVVVEELRGTRPLVPKPAFGQSRIPLLSTRLTSLSGRPVQNDASYWVSIPRFHVLDPVGLHMLLAYRDDPASEQVLAFGSLLAGLVGGRVTLLEVLPENLASNQGAARLQHLVNQWFAGHPQVETRLRRGEPIDEIRLEAQQSSYELLLISSQYPQLSELFSQLCRPLGLPVLLVPGSRHQLRRILVCTAAGEPGKSDIRFSGRIARRAKANVTLFHVMHGPASPGRRGRIDQHLLKGQDLLTGLGVLSESVVETRLPVLEGIIQRARSQDYDLIVLGAPEPGEREQAFWSRLAAEIMHSTALPLLIVPMEWDQYQPSG